MDFENSVMGTQNLSGPEQFPPFQSIRLRFISSAPGTLPTRTSTKILTANSQTEHPKFTIADFTISSIRTKNLLISNLSTGTLTDDARHRLK